MLAAFPPLCIFVTTTESTAICFVKSQTDSYDFPMTFVLDLKECFFRKLKSSPPDLTADPRRLLH